MFGLREMKCPTKIIMVRIFLLFLLFKLKVKLLKIKWIEISFYLISKENLEQALLSVDEFKKFEF
jgi:hypothetical protein